MNKKTITTLAIILVIIIMGYLLYRTGIQELNTRSSAPYPLAEVEIKDYIKEQASQSITSGATKFNVSTDFNITDPIYSKLPMYEFSPSANFSDETINNIIGNLELTKTSERQSPVYGKTIIASATGKNLVVYAERGELIYSEGTGQEENNNSKFGANPNIELFKPKAEELIKSLKLENSSFEYDRFSYVIADSMDIQIKDQSRTADMIQLTYKAKVENLPIIDKSASLVPNMINVWAKPDGSIVKLHYQSIGQVGNVFGNYTLYNRDEIRKNLLGDNTKAKLINGDYIIGNEIESINVQRASLAYIAVENYLVPVYILEANVRTKGNYSGTGYLLYEAIKK